MTTISAYQFEVHPTKDQTSAACLNSVRDELTAWVGDLFASLGVAGVRPTFDRTPLLPLGGHELRGDERECPTHRLLTLDWERNDPEASLLWRCSARMAADARLVQAAFVMQVLPLTPGLRGLRYTADSSTNPHRQLPLLTTKLITTWDCRVDGQPIPLQPRLIRKAQVEAFVHKTLCDRHRMLPVVVVPLGEGVDAGPGFLQRLQDHLLGLALVAGLANLAAAERMTKLLGYKLGCEEGVRIYYAGFTPDATPDGHPFQTAKQLQQSLKEMTLAHLVYGQLAPTAGGCFVEGRVLRAARSAFEAEDRDAGRVYAERMRAATGELDEARQALARLRQEYDGVLREAAAIRVELRALREQAGAIPAALPAPPQEALDELTAALERAWDENRRLQAEGAAAHRQAAALKTELYAYREKWATLGEARVASSGSAAPAAAAPGGEREFASPADALAAGSVEFADVLTVWDDARRSAAESPYAMPAKVFQALRAIAEVGRDYFQAQNGGPPLGPIDHAFQARVPFKYAGFESQTTLSKYGSERVFHDGEYSRQMQRHLTLGGGTTNNCLQIYFDFDAATGRILIGYCGRHLSFSRMRS